MSRETEDLIRKLAPVIGRSRSTRLLGDYNESRFSPAWRKSIEREVSQIAQDYGLDEQIILYPVPRRRDVLGDYQIGWTHYGRYPLNASFGLREQDFIKHAGIFGATGSGKTNTAWGLVRQLCEKGKPFLILDPKGTWQGIIRTPWARDVKVFRPGSDYAPYTFNPFTPPGEMDTETWVSEAIEVFCDSQFLGFGAKEILRQAVQGAHGDLTLRTVFEAFQRIDKRGYKKSQWASSTERALKSATTGILGRVLTSPENIPFGQLMDSPAVMVLDGLSDDDQVALFMALMLARIYWFRKLAGVKERFRHLLIIEEFHVFSSAEMVRGESRIDSIIRMCREFSQGVLILDQNPGKVSPATLGNLNTLISMNLGSSQDINAVGTAMVLDAEAKRHLGRLPTGWAICRVKDRFPDAVLVRVPLEVTDKREVSPEEIRQHNGDFVKNVDQKQGLFVNSLTETWEPVPGGSKLEPMERKLLRWVSSHPGSNLKSCYLSLGLTYRQGNRLSDRLESMGYLRIDRDTKTATGSETRLSLTGQGKEAATTGPEARRLGGKWHQKAIRSVARHYERNGYLVRTEFRDIDVVAEKGGERIAIEVESLERAAGETQAVANIRKALEMGYSVVSVVKDEQARQRLESLLKGRPHFDGVKIRLLGEI